MNFRGLDKILRIFVTFSFIHQLVHIFYNLGINKNDA